MMSISGGPRERPLYDLAIVGAGPAGTTAAIYAARARLSVIMIAKAKLGGALGITHRIANWPGSGYDRPLSGAELLRQMHEHAASFGAEFLQSEVYALLLEGTPKEIVTAEGNLKAKTVLIATGAGSRLNRLPGEEEFMGSGVSNCAICDAAFYVGRAVAVVGSSQEAVEEALVLARFAGHVHVLCPTAEFIAEPDAVAELRAQPNVTILPLHRLRAIQGEQTVNGVLVAHDGLEEVLPVEGVFVYLPGNRPATAFVEGQVELDERGFIVTDAELMTSQPGVFAAGDVRGGPVQQVVMATADGCLAALGAERYIKQRERLTAQR
ncbi:MAG: NAD(P)/FAD-dependent oxidoreductase [Chloroflexota bacterium]